MKKDRTKVAAPLGSIHSFSLISVAGPKRAKTIRSTKTHFLGITRETMRSHKGLSTICFERCVWSVRARCVRRCVWNSAADAPAFEQAQIFEHRAWLHILPAWVGFRAVLSRIMVWLHFNWQTRKFQNKVQHPHAPAGVQSCCLFSSRKPARVMQQCSYFSKRRKSIYIGISWNKGTPKSSIWDWGFSFFLTIQLGDPPEIGNPHIRL